MKDLMFLYAYLFPCKNSKINIQKDVLGSNALPSLVDHTTSSFPEDKHMYKNEIYLEALVYILKPIISNEMVCRSVFSKRVLTYVYLVNHILHIFLMVLILFFV
jgi:hypothetical protein